MGKLGKGGREQVAEDVDDDAEGVGLLQDGDAADVNSSAELEVAFAQDDGRDGDGGVMAEIWVIIKMSLPTTCYFVLARSFVVVVLIFVGRSGNTAQLSAAALANTSCNVSGFSVMVGLAGAIPTISGQHFGAGRLRKVGHTLQLSLVVLGLACVPLTLLWLFSERVLLALGQGAQVSAMASVYLQLLIPSLWAFGAVQCVAGYLQAQGLMRPAFVATAVVAPMHVGLCAALFLGFGANYLGGAAATSLSNVCIILVLVLYMKRCGLHTATWFGWERSSLVEWRRFLSLASAGVIMLSEWWASEINILMAGVLPNAEAALAAMSVHQISIGMCFYFSLGISIAASTRVSNAVGAGHAHAAKLATTSAVVVCVMGTSVIATAVLLSRNVYWHAYTRDPALGALIARNMLVLSVYAPLDGMCIVLGGVLKGVGQQRKGAYCVVLSYYVVGLPTSWYLAFGPGRSLGIPRVMSLCVGGTVGTAVHTLLFAALVWRIDWQEETKRAAALAASTRALELKPLGESGAMPASAAEGDEAAADGGDEKQTLL